MTPGITTNPHNTAHTPGGSSSGSAAAVADFMVPAAFGTQTGGSVLRPASYCGVFGFKPTFGAFNRRGVYPAAESLDTIGLIARSIDDIELVSAVLELRPPSAARALDRPPRIGFCRTPLWDKAQPETVAAIEDAAARLGQGRRGSCARSRCRTNSRGCATPRARPSTITSAPPRWRRNGTPTATASASGCASASSSGAPCRTATISRLAARRKLPRATAARVRGHRRAADALRQRRGARRPRRDRRSRLPGDLDHPAHPCPQLADPSRPERIAGRHPAGRADATTTASCSPARAGSGNSSARPRWSAFG